MSASVSAVTAATTAWRCAAVRSGALFLRLALRMGGCSPTAPRPSTASPPRPLSGSILHAPETPPRRLGKTAINELAVPGARRATAAAAH
ncbi:MAG: hypothetical protein JF597_15645 [Streptomyces sp.]|uniref:hypothetical protein n=1 Tax=Streptomyces sp. TaxID=1931 RepID=UPI0025DA25D3|nr:hypothetical protein [Streptomyces sp.]MBW8794982.1 hypothetical protein [Streptomyces sp.]